MAAEPTVFQVFNETPGSRKTKYDYTSVQTLYDPGKAQSDHGRREQKSRAKTEANYNYKPTALRTWFLLFVVAFLLGCVAAAEYALRKEPSTSEVYKNTTSSLSNRDSPSVAPKGWLGAAWGNNLAPDGKPRAQGLPRMDRGDFGLVERVPGSNAFMPTGLTTRTSRVMPMSQTKEIPTSRTITTERTVLVTITPPAETSKDRKPTSTDKTFDSSHQETTLSGADTDDKTSIMISEDLTSPSVARTTLVDQTTVISITEVTQVPTTTTDSSGNAFTTLVDKTLVSAQTVTTQAVSTLADEDSRTWTTLAEKIITIPATTTRVPVTTTDSSGRLITTLRETTLPAQTITTQVASTLADTEHGRTWTTLVEEITTIPAITTRVPVTTTDSSGRLITTLRETTLPAQTITTQVASTLADTEHGRTWTTLVEEITTIPAIITRVPVTTTDSSGKLITTLRETTLSAQNVTTHVVSTVSSDGQDDGNSAWNSENPTVATALGLETQRRLIGSTVGGSPTAMVIVSTLAYATVVSTTIPTVVPGGPGGGDVAAELEVLGLTSAQYFAGAFLPTVLAVVATSLLEVIGTNAKLMQPFQALASAPPGGASAEASVFLRFDEWLGALTIPQAVRLRQPLIVATQLVVLGSAFLAPLAAEAVAISTPSSCKAMCYGKIAVQRAAARVLEGLIGVIAVLLVVVVALTNLRRWRTGVNHNPWSIAGMASLCLNRETREVMNGIPRGGGSIVTDKDILKVLNGRRYMLGDFADPTQHGVRYGLVVVDDDGRANQKSLLNAASMAVRGEGEGHQQKNETNSLASRGFSSWLAPLSWWFRALLIFFVASVMAIVAYYEDSKGNSGFERFMDSRGFGVRFFSTMLGVLLGGLMGALFECVAVLTPFVRLSQRALPAERSILLSPPTNAFSGLVSAYRQRSPFLGIFSLTTILAKIVLPVTLDHVPFSYNVTWLTQQVCAWLSIGILAMVIIVVTGSFLIRWPNLPVDPSTIAGAMFYVCDSYMLEAFDDLARKSKRERDSDVRGMGAWYAYKENTGASQKERVKVDACRWKAE